MGDSNIRMLKTKILEGRKLEYKKEGDWNIGMWKTRILESGRLECGNWDIENKRLEYCKLGPGMGRV